MHVHTNHSKVWSLVRCKSILIIYLSNSYNKAAGRYCLTTGCYPKKKAAH